jgi:DNA polymerase-3 subunit gamma/tau
LEPGALALIVRASEGSVRDGLSLLDQAIAYGAGTATEGDVRDMLGLADRSLVFDLFEVLMGGKIDQALRQLRAQYDQGADPLVVLQDLLDLSHNVTRLKVVPDGGGDLALSDGEHERLGAMAQKLSMPVLGRTWQMLLKGIGETRTAPSPIAAAEMILVRIAYAADLPSPADLVREIKENSGAVAQPPSMPGQTARTEAAVAEASATVVEAAPTPTPTPISTPEDGGPENFAAVVKMFGDHKEGLLHAYLTNNVRLVSFAPGTIVCVTEGRPPPDLAPTVARRLSDWTGRNWEVRLTSEGGGSTLAEQATATRHGARQLAGEDPLVQQALEVFPGAEITDVRDMTGDGLGVADPQSEADGDGEDHYITREAGE